MRQIARWLKDEMKVYFSNVRIIELHRYYHQIAHLFLTKEKNEMSQFLLEIKNSGCCDIERYRNIYSILNRLSTRCESGDKKKSTKKQKNNGHDSLDITPELQVIDLMRMQFATRYYITTAEFESEGENSNSIKMRR